MDPRFNGLSDSASINEYEDNVFYPSFSDPPNFSNGYQLRENHMDSQFSFPSLDPSSIHPSPKIGSDKDSPDDNHSNPVLKYLNQILLEENMEERPSMFHDSIALQATEKSLYDALGEKYPSSPYQLDHNANSPDSLFRNSTNSNGSSSYVDPSSIAVPGVYKVLPGQSFGYSSDRQGDVPAYNNLIPNVYNDNESPLQFQNNKQLIIDLDKYQLPAKSDEDFPSPSIKLENEVKDECLEGSRERKHLHWEESVLDEEQRCSKQSAIHEEEEIEISELLDQIFLCNDPKIVLNCSNADNVLPDDQNGVTNGVSNGRSRTKRKANISEVIDLSTLLVNCAQSVAANDRRTANELLKKIRQNSSTSGDACQRLAHVFANGLEARLAGTGTQLYAPVVSKRRSAAEMLKAYQVYLSASPFKLIPIFFANKMISDLASKAEAIHIVDFGILYGFQWPILIQHLSTLPGGPPRLRITGIEYPQPGFRPAERVVETGQRLAKYCDRFHVPFEYQAIATQNWEEIKVKDLNLKKSEVLVVNSLFRFKNLLDETVVADSPRDAVLKLIRAMDPNLFVNAVINGSYSSPFFVRRFREALYHYSSLFDMFDSTIPREDERRMKFEQEFYGREVLNVVSCEGMDRVERPETYKQWQIHHFRAGLKPLPLEQENMNKLRGMVKKGYHKDFIFDEDGCWMLQGWKGRIICASSCWIPA